MNSSNHHYGVNEIKGVLKATVPGFSTAETDFIRCFTDNASLMAYFDLKFYANGSCSENMGYVSILFRRSEALSTGLRFGVNILHFEFNCTASVIDADGNKRFFQSCVYVCDSETQQDLENNAPMFGFDTFIKREFLLKESSELLPDDQLTVYMEITCLLHAFGFAPVIFSAEDSSFFRKGGDKYYLDLDSELGLDLCKSSKYFHSLLNSSMIESETRLVHVPSEEVHPLHTVSRIIKDSSIFISLLGICDLYIVADKYDIQSATETCRQLIKSILCAINDRHILKHAVESVPGILGLATFYRDDRLEGIVETFLDIKAKFESCLYTFQAKLKKEMRPEWNCRFREEGPVVICYMTKIGSFV